MIRAYAIADASRRPTKELLSGHFETSIPLGHLPQCAPFAVSRSLVLNPILAKNRRDYPQAAAFK